MIERSKTIIKGAEMHDCTFEITKQGETPAGRISDDLAREVQAIVGNHLGSLKRFHSITAVAVEDDVYFLNRVIDRGGRATYMVWWDLLLKHRTQTAFDIDEEDMLNGIVALGIIAVTI